VKFGRLPSELEEQLDYADFVELVAFESLDEKPKSPFGEGGAEAALFEALTGRR
jgi:hypothetical protein